jgi:hypothetical protein
MSKVPTQKLHPFILEFIEARKYFSLKAIKATAVKRKLNYRPTTINQYLSDLKSRGKVFDAGRGWYSSIASPFVQDTTPVKELVSRISAKFPFLPFASWSTEQLQGYSHHMMARFTRFVYTDVDSMSSVTEFLREINYDPHLNPRKNEAEKYFTPSQTTVVVRPSVSEEPVDGNYATVEKMLLDLFVEKDKLYLLDEAEYNRIFRNLALSCRINLARLLRYADRRKVKGAFIRKVLTNSADAILM